MVKIKGQPDPQQYGCCGRKIKAVPLDENGDPIKKCCGPKKRVFLEQEKLSIYASKTEEFLAEKFAPEVLSFYGRMSIIFTYLLICVVAIWGAMNVEVDFKLDFFISEGDYLKQYFDLNDEFFQAGFIVTLYVENEDIDYSAVETQH